MAIEQHKNVEMEGAGLAMVTDLTLSPLLSCFRDNRIRAISIDGKPWFVNVDVCELLDLRNPHDALMRLGAREKGKAKLVTAGGVQEMSVVNESGLYCLGFTSRKPEAEAFREWVTDEVLPSLRRGVTGERQASRSGSVYVRFDHPGLYRTIYESNGLLTTIEVDDSYLAGEAESAEADAVALAAMLVATLWRNHRLLDQVKAFSEFSNNRFQMDEAIRQANDLAETLIRTRQTRRDFSDSLG